MIRSVFRSSRHLPPSYLPGNNCIIPVLAFLQPGMYHRISILVASSIVLVQIRYSKVKPDDHFTNRLLVGNQSESIGLLFVSGHNTILTGYSVMGKPHVIPIA